LSEPDQTKQLIQQGDQFNMGYSFTCLLQNWQEWSQARSLLCGAIQPLWILFCFFPLLFHF